MSSDDSGRSDDLQPAVSAGPNGPPPLRVHFMLIGGTKCATTWLSEVLRRHPEISHSRAKSPHFFSTDAYERGWKLYADQFEASGRVRGESSTSYLYRDRALDRIHRWFPEVRFLVVLRDPWERAISHVSHKLRLEHPADLSAYLAHRPHLVTDGLYADRLEALVDRFSRDSIRVFFYEEIEAQPEAVVRSAYTHVGVNPDELPEIADQRLGGGFTPRFRALERGKQGVARMMRRLGLEGWIRTMKAVGLDAAYRSVNAGPRAPSDELVDRIELALRPFLDRMIEDVESLVRGEIVGDRPYPGRWLADLRRRQEAEPGPSSTDR